MLNATNILNYSVGGKLIMPKLWPRPSLKIKIKYVKSCQRKIIYTALLVTKQPTMCRKPENEIWIINEVMSKKTLKNCSRWAVNWLLLLPDFYVHIDYMVLRRNHFTHISCGFWNAAIAWRDATIFREGTQSYF